MIADRHDEHARHWAAFIGDEIVAAARMCVHDEQEQSPDASAFSKIRLPAPIATINRLVVVPSARKSGLAEQFDKSRIIAAKSEGAKCIVGTAAPARIEALERLGFRLTGEQWIQSYCESPAMHAMVLML
jgi:predicted GNAT family N-acyltransferase